MSFITKQEMMTHLYEENINVITRENDTILTAAIDAAVAEAKGYLGAYDREAVFAQSGDARNPLLLIFVKDIAVWHFINLCNAGTDLELRRHRYERAIDWLKSVQRGDVTPDLDALSDEKPSGMILSGSNPKRENHF